MKKTYRMEDLDCASCAAKMETAVAKLDGVKSCSVSYLTQKMVVETDSEDQNELMRKIQKLCRKIEPDCVIRV
jgi:copper chaperone CopZ